MHSNHSNPLKIAVIIQNYTRIGGAERYCVELTELLAKQHTVNVFCQHIGTTKLEGIQFHIIPQWIAKPRYLNDLLFSHWVRKATEHNFDIIHSHSRIPHANIQTLHVPCVLSRYTETSGIKKALRYLNTLLSPRMLSYLWLEKQQLCIKDNRQIIVVSEFHARNILRSYPNIVENISIAYPGIHITQSLNTQLINRAKQRDLLHLSDDKFTLLFVANDYKNKGLTSLLSAIHQVNNTKVHLIVAGNDQLEKFSEQINQLSLTEQIHFIGACEDMNTLYPAADALVHPTLADTYAMVVLEAMAHNLPVIVSNKNYCGFSEHLSSNEALLIDNPKDSSEIARHIIALQKDAKLRQTLARNGKMKANTLSWDNTLQQTLLAYHKVLAID